MKRLGILFGLLVIPLMIWGADPANNSVSKTTATITIDSQHTAALWELVDSTIVAKTDSADTYYHISGTAAMDAGDRLFIGIATGSTTQPVDTFEISIPKELNIGKAVTVYFGFVYVDSLRSQTDADDSIFVRAAVGGSSNPEKVTLTTVRLTGTVINFD